MTLTPFQPVTGAVVPLLLPNIDTDVIIRIERLTSQDPMDLAAFALESLRYRPDGTEDPACVLNQAAFRGAPILLAGPNFGCGSSREPAVWALSGLGIRVVVAPSFGDIFKVNCFQNGLLAVTLPAAGIRSLAAATSGGVAATVDLEAQEITVGSATWSFEVAPVQKRSLLTGRDDLELALSDRDDIATWEAQDRLARPWAWPVPATEESGVPQ